MSERGRALRAAREAAGISLSRMASLTHYSKASIGHLETGRRAVTGAHVAAYEGALAVRIDPTPGRVGSVDVELVAQATDLVTAVGLRRGGLQASEMAAAHWKWVSGLLSQAMTDAVRPSLYEQAARLVDRLAWSLADSGRADRATKVYGTALELAAADSDMRAVVRVNLANHYTTVGAPGESLALLETLGSVPSVLEFTSHSARARAWATLGEWEAAVRHIGLADEAHASVDLADLPALHRPYVSGHVAHPHNEAGKALHTLAGTGCRRAVPLAVDRLTRAVGLFGPDRARAVSRCERRLASLAG